MAVNPTHRELVKAIAVGDTNRAHGLNESIQNGDRDQYHLFVTAFFSIMLEHRFADDSSRDAIAKFVEEMRYDYRNADPAIKPWAIEGVIRASCGEEHLLDEISAEDTLSAEYQVIGKIAVQSPTVIPQIDGFLDEAEKLANEWASQD